MKKRSWTQLTKHWGIEKIGGWLRRYLPAEITGSTMALLGVTMALHLEYSMTTVALIGVWSELIGFYSAIICQEWWAAQGRRPAQANLVSGRYAGKNRIVMFGTLFISVRQTIGFLIPLLRNLVLEFGAAELLDPLILRPALLLLAMHLISDLPLALIAGKLTADLVFYAITISSLEVRKKLLMA